MIPIEITSTALEEVKNIMEHKNIPKDYGLRIGVRGGGGCSAAGMDYMIGFDTKKENDKQFEIDNIPVFIDRKHFMYIIGTKLEYITDNDKTGFTFSKKE